MNNNTFSRVAFHILISLTQGEKIICDHGITVNDIKSLLLNNAEIVFSFVAYVMGQVFDIHPSVARTVNPDCKNCSPTASKVKNSHVE